MSNPRDFGATGDGTTDDTAALQHAIDQGDGLLELPRGTYRITKTLVVDLTKTGRTGITAPGGGAKIVIAAPVPAISLKGTHGGTGDPLSVKPAVWSGQRHPFLSGFEIEGAASGADGIELEGTMQAHLHGLLVRQVRHAVRLHTRNRNVLVDHCHLYHNTGVGLFLDGVNLHQINVTGCHISYNRLGGIRVQDSEVRNLQITGNDIEYNNHRAHKTEPEPTAEILIDATAEGSSVREVTIASNTIQATYSPGGANIRLLGQLGDKTPGRTVPWTAGMTTITGNIIGSQETNVHLVGARDVNLTGNFIYSAHHRNLLATHSRNVTLGANTFGHNPPIREGAAPRELATGIRFEHCHFLNITGISVQDSTTGTHTLADAPKLERTALVELHDCHHAQLNSAQVLDGIPYGIDIHTCSHTTLADCHVHDTRQPQLSRAAVRWHGPGQNNRISAGSMSPRPEISPESNVETS